MVARIATFFLLASASNGWAATPDVCKLSQPGPIQSGFETPVPTCDGSCQILAKQEACGPSKNACNQPQNEADEQPHRRYAGPRCLEAGPTCAPRPPTDGSSTAVAVLTNCPQAGGEVGPPTYGWTRTATPQHRSHWHTDQSPVPPTRPPIR
ncbi:MAG: hypothetical protein VX589_18510 [Myxococcota bacterium]|nr:hypothetical protein [Myxococcota bacterium]